MFSDLYMYRNNLKVLFLNFCKGINKLSVTLFMHWNVRKYSDLIILVQPSNIEGVSQVTGNRERQEQILINKCDDFRLCTLLSFSSSRD